MSMWKKTTDDDTLTDPMMFSEDQRPEAPQSVSRSVTTRQAASIGPSIEIKGDISGNEDLVVHGKVEGTLSLPKNNVVVGADGIMQANVNAMSIAVEGKVVGDLIGSERVLIRGAGRVQGNITAPRVVLEDGAKFKGSIDMDMEDQRPQSATAPKASPGGKDTVASVKRVGGSTSN